MLAHTVHVAVFDTLADWEIGYLTAHLTNGLHQREPGRFTIATVGPSREPVTTMGRLRITPDLAIADLDPGASAMLVLPGGQTWETGALAPFEAAASRFVSAGVPVAAICGATFGLARAGLLDNRPHTSNALDYLRMADGYSGAAHYVDAPVVSDGAVITAPAIEPVAFTRAVFARLDAYEPDVLDTWYRFYGDRQASAYYDLVGG